MASMTVQVSAHTHKLLPELAATTGEPLQKVLERAVEHYRRGPVRQGRARLVVVVPSPAQLPLDLSCRPVRCG